MDQGGDNDESDRALGIRGENACDEAAAAGELVAELGNLDDGDGGGGGMAAIGTPDRSTMSRNQWKRFKEIAKRIQGRK